MVETHPLLRANPKTALRKGWGTLAMVRDRGRGTKDGAPASCSSKEWVTRGLLWGTEKTTESLGHPPA
jgi:hypothetical protein